MFTAVEPGGDHCNLQDRRSESQRAGTRETGRGERSSELTMQVRELSPTNESFSTCNTMKINLLTDGCSSYIYRSCVQIHMCTGDLGMRLGSY